MSLYDEALAAFRHGDNERARELSEELRSSGREVDGLCMLARVALREGDAERTRELAEQAQETARALGDRDAERMPIHLRAAAARIAGDYAVARDLYLESIELSRECAPSFVAAELHNLAYVELHDDRLERAKELFEESLQVARERELDSLLPYLVVDKGVVAAEEGSWEQSARLLAAGAASFEARGEVLDPDDQGELDRAMEKVFSELEPARIDELWAEGVALSIDEALA